MPRSSDSIASLAAALAKAQAELVNPEKSLTATISAGRSGGPDRSFRYAPLASGLDIVRKTLGQHEIATMQTTAIDQTAGLVSLTTTLAHSSGEWIASDWPVCPVAETANPQRMGAALTYARRYALFTLVGIAGEDDLDAPDLAVAPPLPPTTAPDRLKGTGNGTLNGGYQHSAERPAPRRYTRLASNPAEPTLGPEASAELCDRLLAELDEIGGSEAAALWAKRSLPEKNSLTATYAQRVEEGFRTRLASLATSLDEIPEPSAKTGVAPTPQSAESRNPETRQLSKAIDKSALTLPEPRRVRDRDHVKYVARQSCLVCGRHPSDAHHLRFAQSRALGRKVSDEFTVPLCRGHHREVHRHGDEAAWWRKAGIDPTVAARNLWLETHPLATASDKMREVASIAAAGSDKANTTRNRSLRKRGRYYKTNPIVATDP
jgi:hypothetical protein